jgi:hypothetical protein
MFRKKYTLTLLDSKWNVIKRNLNLVIIPRKDEYVFFEDSYYVVLNVIHMLNKKQDVFVVVEQRKQPNSFENEEN